MMANPEGAAVYPVLSKSYPDVGEATDDSIEFANAPEQKLCPRPT